MFSKALLSKVIKSWDCVGKSFLTLKMKAFWTILQEKKKDDSNQHFILFKQCFLLIQTENLQVVNHIYFVACKFFECEFV